MSQNALRTVRFFFFLFGPAHQRTLSHRLSELSSVFTLRCSQQRIAHRGDSDIKNEAVDIFCKGDRLQFAITRIEIEISQSIWSLFLRGTLLVFLFDNTACSG